MKQTLVTKIFFLASMLAMMSIARAQDFQYSNHYTSSFASVNDMVSDVSGNLYLIGYFQGTVDFDPGAGTNNLTSTGSTDVFVKKLDASNNLVWAVSFGGTSQDVGNGIVLDGTGNIYVTGGFEDEVDFDPGAGTNTLTSAGLRDVYVLKLNNSGVFQWAYQGGGAANDQGDDLVVDGSGNVFVTGSTQGGDFDNTTGTTILGDGSEPDILIVKLNSLGVFDWGVGLGQLTVGGGGGTSILLESSGDVFVGGRFEGTVDFNPTATVENHTSNGGWDTFLAQFSSAGVFQEALTWGGTEDDYFYEMEFSSTGDLITVGSFDGTVDLDPYSGVSSLTSLNSNADRFIQSLDVTAGSLNWVIQTDRGGSSLDLDADDNIYSSGLSMGIFDIDGNNIFLSNQNNIAVSALEVVGSSFYTAGYTQGVVNFDLCSGTNTGGGSLDAFLAKYDIESLADVPAISASNINVCGSEAITLSIESGNLNSATSWQWRSGSCTGSFVGTGSSISVTPTTTTTYFVRGVGYSCLSPEGCASITINVNAEPPTDITLPASSINENLIAGTTVGTLSTTDNTPNDTHQYRLITGDDDDDNASFTLTTAGLLSTNETFDFEVQNTYLIRVESEDAAGCVHEKALSISVNDVTPEPPKDISLDFSSIDENNAINDVIGSFSTTDDDAGEMYSYALVKGVVDNNSFNINRGDLRASESFDYETKSSYSILVETDDGNGGTLEKAFSIEVNDVIESTNDILTFSIPEESTVAVIDETDHIVTLTVPYVTDRSSLTPTLTVNTSATVSPASGVAQNFLAPVTYTVTAENGTQQDWEVSVLAPIPAGIYTIGAGQEFTSLVNLTAYLDIHGISGDVIFELTGNQHAGQSPVFIFEDYPGTDQHSFTLRPASGVTNIDFNTSLRLNGVENFNFEGMGEFNITGGITIQNGVNDPAKTAKNVTISGTSMTSGIGIYVRGVDGLDIDGNTMRGVAVSGAAQIYRYSGILVDNITEVKDVTIRNNDIYFGQEFNPSSTQSSVYGVRQGDPISGYLKIYNNAIRLNPAQTKGGIIGLIANADDVEIYHNTILLEGGDGSTLNANCINATATNSAIIKNNILDADVTQTGISASISQVGINLTDSSIPTVEIEDNNITFLNADRSYDGYIRLDGGNALDEDDLATIDSQFPGTTYSDVSFVDRNNGDYQLAGASLSDFNLRGTPIAEITTDIEGTTRSTYASSKGALEAPFNFIVWDGSAWSNGSGPSGGGDDVVIDGDYNMGTDGYFDSRDLTVNTGATMTIDGESSLIMQRNLINNGTLIVESGSSLLTYSPNTITGNDITFKRNTRYADGKYSFVGSPVEQDASIVGSDLGSSVYSYNETTAYGADGINRWEDASADELVPGKGYTQAFQQEIVFTGMPNQGTITIDGTFTDVTNADHEGWVLVSNPYPAPIDVADFLSGQNTTGSIYIWDDNGSDTQRGTNADYIVANGFMVTTTSNADNESRYDNIMGSMQGFFVKLNDASDVEIEFREDMRVTGNSDDHFFRETSLPIARINLTDNNGLFRQTVIGLAEDATIAELNTTYDAQAFNASSDYGLYTVKAGRSLSLNGMTNNWETIQLQVNTAETGIYQISVELEEYDQDIYLRDNLTGDVTDLRNESYSFTAQAGINTDRFELVSSPSDVLGLEESKVLVYAHNSILYIQQDSRETREYQLFNMKGQQLLSTAVRSKGEFNLSSYAKGIYLVFDGQKTHKIILD